MSEFPEWAPKDVVRWLAEWEARPGSERDMLSRLLTFDEMRDVWGKIRTIDSRFVPCLVFGSAAVCGFRGPIGIERMPPKAYEKWKEEVKETALRLARLIQGTDFDKIIEDEIADIKREDTMQRIKEGLAPRDLWLLPGPLSGSLNSMARIIDNPAIRGRYSTRKYQPEIALSRPNADEARRQYFARVITGFFLDHFNQKHRRLVGIAVTAAFATPEPITERQIIRMAP